MPKKNSPALHIPRKPCEVECRHPWCSGYFAGHSAGYVLGDERARENVSLPVIAHRVARAIAEEVGAALRHSLGIGVLTIRVRGVPFPIEFADWTLDRPPEETHPIVQRPVER